MINAFKAISSNKNNKLQGGQVFIHINRRENIHGLIRNTVYFKEKNKATNNSKVMLQHTLTGKNVEIEEVKYTAPNHGTPAQTNSFLQLRKVLRRILGNKSVKKVNERLLVFCMTI